MISLSLSLPRCYSSVSHTYTIHAQTIDKRWSSTTCCRLSWPATVELADRVCAILPIKEPPKVSLNFQVKAKQPAKNARAFCTSTRNPVILFLFRFLTSPRSHFLSLSLCNHQTAGKSSKWNEFFTRSKLDVSQLFLSAGLLVNLIESDFHLAVKVVWRQTTSELVRKLYEELFYSFPFRFSSANPHLYLEGIRASS